MHARTGDGMDIRSVSIAKLLLPLSGNFAYWNEEYRSGRRPTSRRRYSTAMPRPVQAMPFLTIHAVRLLHRFATFVPSLRPGVTRRLTTGSVRTWLVSGSSILSETGTAAGLSPPSPGAAWNWRS